MRAGPHIIKVISSRLGLASPARDVRAPDSAGEGGAELAVVAVAGAELPLAGPAGLPHPARATLR